MKDHRFHFYTLLDFTTTTTTATIKIFLVKDGYNVPPLIRAYHTKKKSHFLSILRMDGAGNLKIFYAKLYWIMNKNCSLM